MEQTLFSGGKNWGCNIVRFAVHPTALNQRGWDAYFELVDKGVNWATELEMYVIIDWHSIGNLNTEKFSNKMYNTSMAETEKFWQTVAKNYKGNSTVAVYELCCIQFTSLSSKTRKTLGATMGKRLGPCG